jgi:SSS family solute:Na+ symporter
VDPGFHQRVYAAESARSARRGILIAIGFWFLFDLMTTLTGLYAFSYLAPGYEPSQAFLLLGRQILPVGLQGLFLVGILATVMSTLDSTTLVSGITLGSDLLTGTFLARRYSGGLRIKVGMAVILAAGVLLAVSMPSVIDLWYLFGTIAIPALLLPTLTAIAQQPMRRSSVRVNLILPPVCALVWCLFGNTGTAGVYYFGLEPFYPGIFCSLLIFGWQYFSKKEH